ncbi:hypothetical protein ACJRO7_005076 [Eucalyptus globulus]|uniref:Uncharacterized protein n=1 Tax=Eucalyptus globulus TaxID=34317 RepID=A0ABD3J1J1_EUCGL
MATVLEMWSNLDSAMAGLMFAWAMFKQYFPPQLRRHVEAYAHKAVGYVYPYIHIKFPEFAGEQLERCEVYAAIQNYLNVNSTARAKRLKADSVKDSKSLVLSMDENEEVVDEYEGVKLRRSSGPIVSQSSPFSLFNSLTYHRSNRDLITGSYVKHVLAKGKAVAANNRQRKLFTNNLSLNWHYYKATKWSHVTFKHPSTFDTLAMEPSKKREIMNDLLKFKRGRSTMSGLARRTGKSPMIAAMANFLNYDVYDLELMTVKDNTELRKLLIESSAKSITVIEDIDCSLDLTGQMKMKKQEKDDDEEIADLVKKMAIGRGARTERSRSQGPIIVFAMNFVEKLDLALIRRGRMDKHIEMSYCCFKWFKVLARNYLGVELHLQFAMVRQLLEETKMTPADMAENLMPKSDDENEEACLEGLIEALEKAKEDTRKKSEEKQEAAAAKATAAPATVEKEGQQKLTEGDQENGGRRCAKEVK